MKNQDKSSTSKGTKTYSLTKDETSNLNFRRAVLEYLSQVVTSDVEAFATFNILERLGIKGKNFRLGPDNTTIIVGGENEHTS